MIFTSCPECDDQIVVDVESEIVGTWRLTDCENGHAVVIEITRMGGTTHTQEHFENEVLPDLDDTERIDHPDKELTVYGDPDRIKVRGD